MPTDYSDCINEMFSFPKIVPMTLSQSLGRLAVDLPDRVDRIRAFLSTEVNTPQGSTGGIVFINPLPIIRSIASYEDDLSIPDVDGGFNKSYWAARFGPVVNLGNSSWTKINEALTEESQQVRAVYAEIKTELARWELEAEGPSEQLDEFVAGCKEVKSALSETRQVVGDRSVDAILARQDNPVAKWKRVLREVEEITKEDKPIQLLRFRTEDLIDLRASLNTLAKWARSLEEVINAKYMEGTRGGDLDVEISNAQISLDAFTSLTKTVREMPDAEA